MRCGSWRGAACRRSCVPCAGACCWATCRPPPSAGKPPAGRALTGFLNGCHVTSATFSQACHDVLKALCGSPYSVQLHASVRLTSSSHQSVVQQPARRPCGRHPAPVTWFFTYPRHWLLSCSGSKSWHESGASTGTWCRSSTTSPTRSAPTRRSSPCARCALTQTQRWPRGLHRIVAATVCYALNAVSRCLGPAFHIFCRALTHLSGSASTQVVVDVPRTAPEVAAFHQLPMQKSLERILYIWGIRRVLRRTASIACPWEGSIRDRNQHLLLDASVQLVPRMHVDIDQKPEWT